MILSNCFLCRQFECVVQTLFSQKNNKTILNCHLWVPQFSRSYVNAQVQAEFIQVNVYQNNKCKKGLWNACTSERNEATEETWQTFSSLSWPSIKLPLHAFDCKPTNTILRQGSSSQPTHLNAKQLTNKSSITFPVFCGHSLRWQFFPLNILMLKWNWCYWYLNEFAVVRNTLSDLKD